MTGVFKIAEDRIGEMKSGSRRAVVKWMLILWVFFVACALVRSEGDKQFSVILITIVLAVTCLFYLAIITFSRGGVYNTVLELTEQGLERRGDGLLMVRFKFNDIGAIKTKENGTVLLRRGIGSRISMIVGRYVYTSDVNILFIPLAMDNYEAIVRYVKEKSI